MTATMPWQGVLFDLDGTLLDTARDMAGALNDLRSEEGLSPLPFAAIRPHASHGSTAMVQTGFGLAPGEAFEAMRQRFLDRYATRIALETRLFPGGEALLLALEQAGLKWGVVTNKPAYLTDPLMAALELTPRAACIVSGDTLPQRKPHPAPLLHGAAQAGLEPAACVYVGDAERDVQAALAAGMTALVAHFGYLAETDRPDTWGAHGSVHSMADIATWLGLPVSGSVHTPQSRG
jgi:N-acetyl-D-muramate 6-phosphate phosphatase